ncbi:GNAT family N-acetyltransferase [Ruegeria hyattellae]|uniref:GNAT family N-acetyltransferase n=1 Tax=Ruegeria hyattellae TaxID=3233337 RepID=UPI00355B1D35
MTAGLLVGRDNARNADIRALLLRHFELMRDASPEESCHVMEPDALLEAGAVLISARQGNAVLGIGALTEIAPGHGELKSMHTAAEARGRGVARAILQVLIAKAQDRALQRVSLETGSDALFAPARALYTAHGFSECQPFGNYREDPLSVFMTRTLGSRSDLTG